MAKNRYAAIIEKIFFAHYREGDTQVPFAREEIAAAARDLELRLPKNLGDLLYSFRYRTPLPDRIRGCAPEGLEWVIQPAGIGRYAFVLRRLVSIVPNPALSETKVPDATPGVIAMYALSDEQALLARLRYNRLLDIFTGVACYSLQSHLRTTVHGLGQVEIDELYVGISRRGAHHIFPVQAKGKRDRLNVVQMEQDLAMCRAKFPDLICHPIAAQFMEGDLIALIALEEKDGELRIAMERHYRLAPPSQLTPEELRTYRQRQAESGWDV